MRPSRPITRPMRWSSRVIIVLRSARSLKAECELADDALAACREADLEVAVGGVRERVEQVLEVRDVDVRSTSPFTSAARRRGGCEAAVRSALGALAGALAVFVAPLAALAARLRVVLLASATATPSAGYA